MDINLYNMPNLSLAMAYVPVQPPITKLYDADRALKCGTIFPELDMPFLGKRGAFNE